MPGHFELSETLRAMDDRDYRQTIFGFGGGDHRDSADDGAASAAAVTADDFHQDGGQQRGYKERYLNGYGLFMSKLDYENSNFATESSGTHALVE